MSEPNFASLNQSLLARKGGAKPAMRPQHGLVPTAAAAPVEPLEDLGWNDMGHSEEQEDEDSNVVQLPAQDNDVHRQQQVLAEKISEVSKDEARPRASASKRGKRAAFTLRLDAERHLKLRLACTVKNRSAQQIVTEALDTMLAAMPEVEALAAQVNQN